MFSRALLSLFVLTALAMAAPVRLPTATKRPAPHSPSHRKLILEAVQAHDLGDYPGAIRRYEQVLAENPDDVGARFELSHTLMAAKQYNESIDHALKGAEFESPLLADFYAVIASDLDELGDQKGATEIYQQGLRAFPGNASLAFNFAVTCERMNKPDDARRLYQSAISHNPGHASSHYRLAALYLREGYETPGMLAYLRFLELAQDTRRSQQAVEAVLTRLLGSARGGKEPNQVNITVNLAGSSKKDEGDFSTSVTILGIGAALRFTDAGKKSSRPELVRHQHDLLFESFDGKELRKEKKKFAAAYYAAYFRELHKASHTEAFTYSVLRQSGWPEVAEWIDKNPDKLKAYAEWSKAYAWSKDLGKKK
jgi:tetratricopeptide (TPR) repeat protein